MCYARVITRLDISGYDKLRKLVDSIDSKQKLLADNGCRAALIELYLKEALRLWGELLSDQAGRHENYYRFVAEMTSKLRILMEDLHDNDKDDAKLLYDNLSEVSDNAWWMAEYCKENEEDVPPELMMKIR